jgi:hypothetical protein
MLHPSWGDVDHVHGQSRTGNLTVTATPGVAPATAITASPRARSQRKRARSLVGMAVQVILIAVGVFLGLAGEEWREDRENRRLADETLRRFRAEIVVNRNAIIKVKDYHTERLAEIEAYFAADPAARDTVAVQFAGLRPPFLVNTAYEFSLATGSLAYVEADLAFALSKTYGIQQIANELGRAVAQTMYFQPPREAGAAFFATVELYYGDLTAIEPELLASYDGLIPAIDHALAQ